eukprot:921937-Pelagomonas_calceolata.AAC.2
MKRGVDEKKPEGQLINMKRVVACMLPCLVPVDIAATLLFNSFQGGKTVKKLSGRGACKADKVTGNLLEGLL